MSFCDRVQIMNPKLLPYVINLIRLTNFYFTYKSEKILETVYDELKKNLEFRSVDNNSYAVESCHS